MKAPREIDGKPLRSWNRVRWRLGFVPFRRCPNNTLHRVVNVYGDEIMARGYNRSHCLDCEMHWKGLWARGAVNEIGRQVDSNLERMVDEVKMTPLSVSMQETFTERRENA